MSLVPPQKLCYWLNYPFELTALLKERSGQAELVVLQQCQVKTSWWDKFYLGLKGSLVTHRDILMRSGQKKCWFARSIFPEAIAQNHAALLQRLQHESLGQIIFNTPEISRDEFYYYPVTPSLAEYYWPSAIMQPPPHLLWARFSRFTIAMESFFLVELLLPELAEL